MVHLRQSQSNSGLGSQVKVLIFKGVPSSLGSGFTQNARGSAARERVSGPSPESLGHDCRMCVMFARQRPPHHVPGS